MSEPSTTDQPAGPSQPKGTGIDPERQARLQALYDRSTETLVEGLSALYRSACGSVLEEMTARQLVEMAFGHAYGEDAYHMNFGSVLDVREFLRRCGMSDERMEPLVADAEAKYAPKPRPRCDAASLGEAIEKSAKQSPYFKKDLAKARRATQMIGQGSPASSTAAYVEAAGHYANSGDYTADDVVFISAEGMRRGRFSPIENGCPAGAYRHLYDAIAAGASFIVDDPANRARYYNVGERQVAEYLLSRGYTETEPGLFRPPAEQ